MQQKKISKIRHLSKAETDRDVAIEQLKIWRSDPMSNIGKSNGPNALDVFKAYSIATDCSLSEAMDRAALGLIKRREFEVGEVD